jgi:hypothetical protein
MNVTLSVMLVSVSLFFGMGTEFKHYKRKFRNSLEPLFVMLQDKKRRMEKEEWLSFVNKTMHSVLNNPVEFLGTELPEEEMVKDLVQELFVQFVANKPAVGIDIIITTLKKMAG